MHASAGNASQCPLVDPELAIQEPRFTSASRLRIVLHVAIWNMPGRRTNSMPIWELPKYVPGRAISAWSSLRVSSDTILYYQHVSIGTVSSPGWDCAIFADIGHVRPASLARTLTSTICSNTLCRLEYVKSHKTSPLIGSSWSNAAVQLRWILVRSKLQPCFVHNLFSAFLILSRGHTSSSEEVSRW
jgi:hypothetical protein